MKKVEKFNDTVNYSNRAFDYGFRADHVPEKPVYAAHDGEDVFMTILPLIIRRLRKSKHPLMRWILRLSKKSDAAST